MAAKKSTSRSRAKTSAGSGGKKTSSSKKSPARKRSTGKKSSARSGRRTLSPGTRVKWKASQGTVHGTVKKKVTSPMKIKGHAVAASPDNPEYLVESARTGAQAAHKADALQPE